MRCDFYICNYLYVFFENEISYIPICINIEKRYFHHRNNDIEDDERQLIPNKPILIYSKNEFEKIIYKNKFEKIVQQKLNDIDKKWENVSKIKIMETRIERL